MAGTVRTNTKPILSSRGSRRKGLVARTSAGWRARRALDEYLTHDADATTALAATFGVAPGATNLSSRLLAPFRELAVDRAIAERAGRIAREFGIRLPDALIAATAPELGLGLVTRNRKHFDSILGRRLRTL